MKTDSPPMVQCAQYWEILMMASRNQLGRKNDSDHTILAYCVGKGRCFEEGSGIVMIQKEGDNG
jgi:hypothetical protein